MKLSLSTCFDEGINWLISSGVQSLNTDDSYGGFAAWYDSDNQKHSFIYSEITGYALNLLITLYGEKKDPNIKNSINYATEYLTNKAFDPDFGAVKCRYHLQEGWVNNYCTFDNAIIANALINKYRLVQKHKEPQSPL